VHLEQRDRANCCHAIPSSYKFGDKMAPMTCYSNKTERHRIFTSQFGQDSSGRNFPWKWTGRGGPITWPPSSLDLTTLDFFFLGHAEDPTYAGTRCEDESYYGHSYGRQICRHDECQVTHRDPTDYPCKCRSVKLHHITYQTGLIFPFLCLLTSWAALHWNRLHFICSSCAFTDLCNYQGRPGQCNNLAPLKTDII
jgi:hypothetical protein